MKILPVLTIAFLTAGAAAAQPPRPAPTASVRYAADELADPARAAGLARRIEAAAREACRRNSWNQGTEIGAVERFDVCYRDAVDAAATRLAAPRVTAALASRAIDRRLAQIP